MTWRKLGSGLIDRWHLAMVQKKGFTLSKAERVDPLTGSGLTLSEVERVSKAERVEIRMSQPLKKSLRIALPFLIFFLSGAMLAYAWWSFQVERGNRALRRGEAEQAEAIYTKAELPFRAAPWLSQIFPSNHEKLLFSRVRLLYAQGRNDELMEKLDEAMRRAPAIAESAEFSFWTGNVFMRRALQSKKPEEALQAVKTALSEYQKGLAAEPDDWDLKYNYELVKFILSPKGGEKSKEEEKVKSILEKMRPQEPPRDDLPPEKKG